MSKDERPRGLRARLRQRKTRTSSEDEVRSRPMSLDLDRHKLPMLHSGGMQSMTAVPARNDVFYGNDARYGDTNQDEDGGLALGEFGEDGEEVAEDEEYGNTIRHNTLGSKRGGDPMPSGAIVRSHSQEFDQTPNGNQKNLPHTSHNAKPSRGRRESTQSVPTYDSVSDHHRHNGYNVPDEYGSKSDDGDSGANSGNYSYEYSYDEEGDADDNGIPGDVDDFDAEGELNAVYLKRNADFHMLFRNIPINELLIDDYGCALQRDILVQGRLYLTENYVCFYSNIFGWVTNLIIVFDEIVSIEKKMTALIIPNAIQISTLHAKHFFGSFIYRDSAYNQLYDLWAKSKNEKNAGLPEIGHAEDGSGAGDVSRHREDVLNAYQSLTEESGDESQDGDDRGNDALTGSVIEEDEDEDELSNDDIEADGRMEAQSGFEEESEGSISDTESERSTKSIDKRRRRLEGDVSKIDVAKVPLDIGHSAAAAAASVLSANNKATKPLEKGQVRALVADTHTGSDINTASGDGDATPSTAGGISPVSSQAGAETTGNSPTANGTADISRAPSQLSTMATKVPTGAGATGTPAAQGSATSLATRAANDAGQGSIANGAAISESTKKLLSKVPRTPDATDTASLSSLRRSKSSSKKQVSSTGTQQPLHKPTSCSCGAGGQAAHYALEALDASFPLSLPLLFRVVFSTAIPLDIEEKYIPEDKVNKEELAKSCTKRIIECGNSDVKTEGWVPDPADDGLKMCIYSYEKALGFSIGPKSTTVEDTFRITMMDFDKAVIVEQVVKTPNVPSGTSFFVKIRHCLTWAAGPANNPPGGWSQYKMTFEVEWIKSSWIKNAIEKGTVDSNKQAGEMLEKYIRGWIAANPAMEVKAQQSQIGPSKASSRSGGPAAPSSHRRGRRAATGGKKARNRDESPHGLRMEELLGEHTPTERGVQRRSGAKSRGNGTDAGGISDTRNAFASDKAIGILTTTADRAARRSSSTGAQPSSLATSKEEADLWRKRADESWAGWACYHSVYPAIRATRMLVRITKTAVSDPTSGPVLVAMLVVLLLFSNIWRFTSVTSGSSSLFDKGSSGGIAGSGAGHIDRIEALNSKLDVLAEQVAMMNKRLQQIIEQPK
ncbi:hypothetical protein BX070DRAFT_226305 [Coemansia spiralis]|nr:hypothetical protein BX070DRAFT_226305 [Coemansia spiralis]